MSADGPGPAGAARAEQRTDPTFAPVGVVGLGVMGGSLVRRLAATGSPVLAWSPDPAERDAVASLPGVTVTRPEDMGPARGVVLAVPLDALADTLSQVASVPGGGGWIQDVASLQAPALEAFRRAGLEERAVSAHPMAGAEGSGFQASREDLYAGARVWLSAGEISSATRDAARSFWIEVGAEPVWTGAGEHDARMGWVSHLPQIVSVELAGLLADQGLGVGDLGPGALDMTRLAASSPGMWAPLLSASPEVASGALRSLARRLSARAEELAAGDTDTFARALSATRAWRETS